MKITIKNTLWAATLLTVWGLGGCSNEEPSLLSGDEVNFVATLLPSATVTTRAEVLPPLTNAVGEITVIAPGYANESATWQQSTYTADVNGALTVSGAEIIKRTALNMPFAAWTTPTGVDGANKTVDFSSTELDNFVGAWMQAENIASGTPVVLPFQHLVSKVTLTVVKEEGATTAAIASAGITFPSIKKTGRFDATLSALPEVTNGASGEALNKELTIDNGAAKGTIFLPPFGNFVDNGTFTLTVGGVDYIGTLNNLKTTAGAPITELKAGQNLILKIKILDDHSVQFMAATIAPWNESEGEELFNRPGPGIWSEDDLISFAAEYAEYKTGNADKVAAFEKKYIKKEGGKAFVRLYTDIKVAKKGFQAIGTAATPFTGITFDGNGYTISGLSLEATGTDNIGLFGCTKDVTLRDVRLTDCTLKGKDNVGVLVGNAQTGTIIDNCRISGKSTASGDNRIGGLVGYIDAGARLTNCCVSEGSISGTGNYVGGIAGTNSGIIANSYAILSNGLSGSYAGGLVGVLKSGATLSNCYASPYFINGTGKDTNGALIGTVETTATAASLYWNSGSISNDNCPSAIGGKQPEADLSDLIEPGTYSAFSAVSGRLINSANNSDAYQSYLFDRLNGYISSLEAGTSYKGWAIIGTSYLPILRP